MRCRGALVRSPQPLRQQVKIALAQAEVLKGRDGRKHVIAIGAGPAMPLPHVVQLLLQR